MKEIERERAERRKVRKKTKNAATAAPSASTSTSAPVANEDVTMADTTLAAGELEDENVIREREKKEFEATIDSELKADIGASVSGLFELCAIVTHKGASADSGHYIGFVKKSVFHPPKSYTEDDEDWYQFDDDKVSVVPPEKIAILDGGGESASAYILLYREKRL